MGIADELWEIEKAMQEHGLLEAVSLLHFRSQSSEGVMGASRIIFRRKDDGREANAPCAEAIELIRSQQEQRDVDSLWKEFKNRGFATR